jgi:hypothetical protein
VEISYIHIYISNTCMYIYLYTGGAFGGDFVEDEDWAEKIRKDKALKFGGAKVGDGNVGGTKLKELEELQAQVQVYICI